MTAPHAAHRRRICFFFRTLGSSRRGLDVVARVMHLFDREYQDALGYPLPGRTAFGGVRVAAGR